MQLMEEKKQINPTLERGVKTYLPPFYHRLFAGYVAYTQASESSSAAHMIKKFFDELPASEKEIYLKQGSSAQSKNSY